MKVGTRITNRNLPKDNGRPQLWLSHEHNGEIRVRILHTGGKVEYITDVCDLTEESRYCYFIPGCTSRKTLRKSQTAIIIYQRNAYSSDIYFGGYL